MKSIAYILISTFAVQSYAAAKEPGITDSEIKLGVTMPMSGPAAVYGEITKGSRAYFEKLNAEGGVNGRKITLIIEDDQYSPAKSVPATRKLVEKDQVFAIFEAAGFPHQAVAAYLTQKKIPSFMIADGAKIWEKYPYDFIGQPTYYSDGETLGEYVAILYPGKTVGVIHENSPGGTEALEGLRSAVGGKAKIVASEGYEPGSSNIDAQSLALFNAKPDVVVSMSVIPISISAMKAATQKNWKPKWLVSYVNGGPEFIALGGEITEGVVSTSFLKLPTSSDPAVVAHQRLLDHSFPGTKASILTLYGQQGAELMAEVLRRAGRNLTRPGAIAAAEGLKNFQSTVAILPASFGPKDHVPYRKFKYMHVQNGKWEFLTDETSHR